MNDQAVIRDERTTLIENASYRLAYSLLSFGVLACGAYRGFMFDQACWDLLALVIFTGFTAAFYQGRHRILSRRYAWEAAAVVLLGAVMGAVAVGVRALLR